MGGKRKRYSADFKAKVALKAIRGVLTVLQLVAKHDVHQALISAWKRQAIEGTAVFSDKVEVSQALHAAEVENLHAKNGQPAVERHPRSSRVRRRAQAGAVAKMGAAGVYQRPHTTAPHLEHRLWPYLLRNVVIDRPNQVLYPDITYILMRHGFLYVVAVIGWAARKVLALSNTMVVEFGVAALDLEEALPRYGRPEIFNTDQGSQSTSPRFTGILTAAGVRVSMDGRGRWISYDSSRRLHSALNGRTPNEAYAGILDRIILAVQWKPEPRSSQPLRVRIKISFSMVSSQ
ncbi:DDE-type integrase/transposase/recombinase [Azospirillum brasilense]|uniref:DDE-type integrase/transposase/recombinase n=1 Tax=Azospirillum brasilense TaxID=192 RepID=UPI001FFFB6F4|nr:DDE-type integrase/transposase/recombinase [Azospirillum brasilense]